MMITTTEARAIAANRYWDNKGQYQPLYEQVKGLIPAEGPANTETLETLRRVSRCYYDIYNNGGWNGFLFAGMSEIVDRSNLDRADQKILRRLFNAASDQELEIWFAHRNAPISEDDIDEDDEDQLDWIRKRTIVDEVEFSQALENLVDWAVRRAWMEVQPGF